LKIRNLWLESIVSLFDPQFDHCANQFLGGGGGEKKAAPTQVVVRVGVHPPVDGVRLQGRVRRETLLRQHPTSRRQPRLLAGGHEPRIQVSTLSSTYIGKVGQNSAHGGAGKPC